MGEKGICMGSRTGMTKRQDLSEGSGVGQMEEMFTGFQNETQSQFSGIQSLTDVQMQLENASVEDIPILTNISQLDWNHKLVLLGKSWGMIC